MKILRHRYLNNLLDSAHNGSADLFSRFNLSVGSLVTLFLSASNAYAIEDHGVQTIKSDPMSGSYLLQLVVGLIIVILCIIALAWFAKKMNRMQSSNVESLKIIGALSMGARERVVLLQVGEEQIVLGVSPGQINTLHILKTPIETLDKNTDASVAGGFADKLKTMIADVNNATGKNKPRS